MVPILPLGMSPTQFEQLKVYEYLRGQEHCPNNIRKSTEVSNMAPRYTLLYLAEYSQTKPPQLQRLRFKLSICHQHLKENGAQKLRMGHMLDSMTWLFLHHFTTGHSAKSPKKSLRSRRRSSAGRYSFFCDFYKFADCSRGKFDLIF